MVLSRRDWLKGAAALSLTSSLTSLPLARPSFAAAAGPDFIDMHSHLFSSEMSDRLKLDCFDPANLPKVVQFTLDELEKARASMAVFSVGNESLFRAPDSAGKVRRMNETFAKVVSDHPTKFRFFASLPSFPDVDATLKEVEYAMGTLKASGVHMYASHGKTWMGDKIYDPVFAELNRRKLIVKTHPTPNDCCKVEGFNITENGIDTMRAITTMLQTGAANRYPDMKIIWSHAGGALLGMVQRYIGDYEDNPKLKEVMPHGPEYELKRFYYDTAQAEHPSTLAALKRLAPMDHIMFGTDFPHRMPADSRALIEKSGVFDAKELAALGSGTARTLLAL